MPEHAKPKLNSLPADLRGWTRTLVTQQHLRAGERLGQHFLVDKLVLSDIVRTAEVDPAVPVLEVGGGFGVLTLALLEQGAQVTSVELDKRLAAGLRKLGSVGSALTVCEGDVIKLTDSALLAALRVGAGGFDIVANLPYEISGAFLRRFLGGSFRPRTMTLLLQREVGERLTAAPGDMSLLGLLAELACSSREVVRLVPPQAFWPAPRVTSCLVRFALRSSAEREHTLGGLPEAEVWRLARIGFAARRKVLKNNLASALPLSAETIAVELAALGLSSTVRAQELNLAHWVHLSQALNARLADPRSTSVIS